MTIIYCIFLDTDDPHQGPDLIQLVSTEPTDEYILELATELGGCVYYQQFELDGDPQ